MSLLLKKRSFLWIGKKAKMKSSGRGRRERCQKGERGAGGSSGCVCPSPQPNSSFCFGGVLPSHPKILLEEVSHGEGPGTCRGQVNSDCVPSASFAGDRRVWNSAHQVLRLGPPLPPCCGCHLTLPVSSSFFSFPFKQYLLTSRFLIN